MDDHDYVFVLAKRYYREQREKAFSCTYKDQLHFIALSHQAMHGTFKPELEPTSGILDLVGADRRAAWKSLGEMSKEEARNNFIEKLKLISPQFVPWLEAQQSLQDNTSQTEDSKPDDRCLSPAIPDAQAQDEYQLRLAQQKLQIKAALNAQTQAQFQQYAQSQHPDDSQSQASLIAELQEQHFQQYMQHIYTQQLAAQNQSNNQVKIVNEQKPEPKSKENDKVKESTVDNNNEGKKKAEEGNSALIANASMWTNPNLKEFKTMARNDKDLVVKVGRGEVVTVRVPTHSKGSCLFWEFATDNYDIGFGVYFEWTTSESSAITVHIDEPSDDEEDEEEIDPNANQSTTSKAFLYDKKVKQLENECAVCEEAEITEMWILKIAALLEASVMTNHPLTSLCQLSDAIVT